MTKTSNSDSRPAGRAVAGGLALTAQLGFLAFIGMAAERPALAKVGVQGRTEVAPEVVTYADLDITRVSGQEALGRRIASAARRVCSADDPTPMVRFYALACVREAKRAASIQALRAIAIAKVRDSQSGGAGDAASPLLVAPMPGSPR